MIQARAARRITVLGRTARRTADEFDRKLFALKDEALCLGDVQGPRESEHWRKIALHLGEARSILRSRLMHPDDVERTS